MLQWDLHGVTKELEDLVTGSYSFPLTFCPLRCMRHGSAPRTFTACRAPSTAHPPVSQY